MPPKFGDEFFLETGRLWILKVMNAMKDYPHFRPILFQLEEYRQGNEAAQQKLLIFKPLGFVILLSNSNVDFSKVVNYATGFNLDVKGEVSLIVNTQLTIEIGEIKKSSQHSAKGVNQVLLPLQLLHKSATILYGLPIICVGKIYFRSNNGGEQPKKHNKTINNIQFHINEEYIY